MKFLFCRVGWMEHYKGVDTIKGGGKFVDQEGYGFESYNFKPYKNELYGYVRSPGPNYNSNINISRLGANKNDEHIDDITVVWFSKNPKGSGQYIIGWYNNATVYRHYQDDLPEQSKRIFENWKDPDEIIGYHCKALVKDTVLLNVDERIFRIPLGSGWSGQSNIWYCDTNSDKQVEFLKNVENYIKYRKVPKCVFSK